MPPGGERKRYRQLISGEEYRAVQDVEMTYFDRLRQEGLIEGKREALIRLLVAKFGPLETTLESRIHTMESVNDLDRWFDKALSASSLEEFWLEG